MGPIRSHSGDVLRICHECTEPSNGLHTDGSIRSQHIVAGVHILDKLYDWAFREHRSLPRLAPSCRRVPRSDGLEIDLFRVNQGLYGRIQVFRKGTTTSREAWGFCSHSTPRNLNQPCRCYSRYSWTRDSLCQRPVLRHQLPIQISADAP
ncbi:hypothetical protein EMPG_17404 [Blastomyces silverae]|uniref:Uncharacterized protein n=1 Tax=Blastomyces silverae TaxID=2060906 RepID=A0A0H1B6T6_9EURO|nr:hypothetical protein EMPG_17404 [Blastomyces silverae]